MKCFFCHRPIAGGEARRRAEYRRQPDGSLKVYGQGMLDGPLAAAAGQLVKVAHNGCYWAATKKEQRSSHG